MTGKRVVGLTGGIGAGKSTVADILGRLGATIVDVDRLGRVVVQPGGLAYQPLIEAFGSKILGPDGQLDRPALGELVFSDADALATLNAITHPAIDIEIEACIEAAETDPVILDMAVLTESDLGAGLYDTVVVVEAPLDQRLDRLLETRGMDQQAAMARIGSQASDAERRAIADHVISNDGTPAELEQRVSEFWSSFVAH